MQIACGWPLKQTCIKAGKESSGIIEKVRAMKPAEGYDALGDRYVDTFEAGIVDPARVTRSAHQDAASIAAMTLTTEAVVSELRQESQGSAQAMSEA